MTSINEMINDTKWCLIRWRERYGSGTRVAIALSVGLFENEEYIKTNDDITSVELDSCFFNEGLWLPVVCAESFEVTIQKLN